MLADGPLEHTVGNGLVFALGVPFGLLVTCVILGIVVFKAMVFLAPRSAPETPHKPASDD